MSFAREDQLLIHCSRSSMDVKKIADAANLLCQPLDWAYIVEASIRHGVSPLLYHGLQQVVQPLNLMQAIPAHTLAELKKLHDGSQRRNERLFGVIDEVAGALEKAGVAAMGLKDVQLAKEVYPAVGLRTMGDIDILIHQADYAKASACLQALGFVPLPGHDIPYTMKYAWGQHFRRPSDEVWIDLQWNVMQIEWDCYQDGSFNFEIDRMWRGAYPMQLGKNQLLAPGPEDMLFHLCMHLEGHTYAELILFCDIVELLRVYADRFDWNYFVEITRKYKVESSIYYVLLLVKQLFEIQLPLHTLEELEPAYFKANLFPALYGNLTKLHLSLDDIRRSSPASTQLMQQFEKIVRTQASKAMELYKAMNYLSITFTENGGAFVILQGGTSERIFPDPALCPFDELQFLIVKDDIVKLQEVLLNNGFASINPADTDNLSKTWQFYSRDPLLVGQPLNLSVKVGVEIELAALLQEDAEQSVSKKDVALRSLRAKLLGRAQEVEAPVCVKIVALEPEALLVYLCVIASRAVDQRLFSLCTLLEFFQGYAGVLDWQRVADLAQQSGISAVVCEALAVAEQVVDVDSQRQAIQAFPGADVKPRVLEWARYGPSLLVRYTELKRAYYYLLGLSLEQGIGAKSTYLRNSLWGRQGKKAILPDLIVELMKNAFKVFKQPDGNARDFAYWIEPEATVNSEAKEPVRA
ncbi:MAG: nucleotidyltransferase family protein [Caldilineaceae bacterium]